MIEPGAVPFGWPFGVVSVLLCGPIDWIFNQRKQIENQSRYFLSRQQGIDFDFHISMVIAQLLALLAGDMFCDSQDIACAFIQHVVPRMVF